jgi:cell wall-associated NlpC family hydrolase
MWVKASAALVTLLLGATLGITGVGSMAAGASASCGMVGGGPVRDLTDDQAENARVIVAVGQQRSVPPRGLLIALMTAMQESTLRNLDYGDRDSLGLFQQRPSMGWGSPTQVRDPAYAAAAFYGGPESPTRNRGLLDVDGWQAMPLTVAAQAVQRSAFPDAYARWEATSRAWLSDILDAPGAGALACAAAYPVVPGSQDASLAGSVAVAAAAHWLGTPYSWGGGNLAGPTLGVAQGARTVGFDCSSLVQHAWNKAGVRLPRTARPQYWAPGIRIQRMSDLRPGDLMFFAYDTSDWDSIHHVAMSLGGDAMVHAPRTGDVVKVERRISASSYWAPQFIGGLRPTG